MKLDRRLFLQGASALGLTGLASGLTRFQASAADTSGYKALVCVFLLGGNDGHDTLFPFDTASYDRYAEIRAPLLDQYASLPGGSTRDRSRLLELSPSNSGDFAGRQFALPEELSGIKSLFDGGRAAIIANVGPLIQPIERAAFEAQSAPIPKRLFSHNDQQSTWQSSKPEGAQVGWGGQFGDAVFTAGAASEPDFVTITSLGNEVFLTGDLIKPYQLGLRGPVEIDTLETFERRAANGGNTQAAEQLRAHFKAMNFSRSNLFERDFAAAMSNALEINHRFNIAQASAPTLSTMFPQSFLATQLRSVAETISIRNALLVNRQVFFVALGGFDTHADQVTDLPNLHRELDGAVSAFYQALAEMGVENDVTLFTASDFGRTLAINGDGTDHGWGNHHFVIGGAVNGGQIYGQVPPYDFGHDQDAGSGRLIPTTSVEQYAGDLGRWFGLNESELQVALPNLLSFPADPIGFV